MTFDDVWPTSSGWVDFRTPIVTIKLTGTCAGNNNVECFEGDGCQLHSTGRQLEQEHVNNSEGGESLKHAIVLRHCKKGMYSLYYYHILLY